MKKILALLLALFMIASLVACSDDTNEENALESIKSEENVFSNNNVGTFKYDVNEDGHYEITKYELNVATPHEVIIPEAINDVPVTSIAADAFKAIPSITAVTVPESVVSIGDYAFSDCDKMTKVTLPASVEYIGVGAFSGCEVLESVSLPKNLTEISAYLFMECPSLAKVEFNDALTTIGEGAFYNCDALTSVVVPSSVTKIERAAFNGCDALASITVPESLKDIGAAAFGDIKAEKVVFSAKADSYFAEYFATNYAVNDVEYAHYEIVVG